VSNCPLLSFLLPGDHRPERRLSSHDSRQSRNSGTPRRDGGVCLICFVSVACLDEAISWTKILKQNSLSCEKSAETPWSFSNYTLNTVLKRKSMFWNRDIYNVILQLKRKGKKMCVTYLSITCYTTRDIHSFSLFLFFFWKDNKNYSTLKKNFQNLNNLFLE